VIDFMPDNQKPDDEAPKPDDLSNLYQEVILDHSRKPRNFRVMPDASCHAEGRNPLCGDHFTVYLKVENGSIKEASFQGDGCAISKASASIMTDFLKGK
jgi:nitrogen fixation NifU-like protein